VFAFASPISLSQKKRYFSFFQCGSFTNITYSLYITSIDNRADGKFWIAPHCIHNKTVQTIADDIAKLADSKNGRVRVLPMWLVRFASLFDSFLKEMIEMMPFWSEDYTIDDSDFCKVFDVRPTSYEEALREHVEFYQSHSM
jgi:hypothetical protein